MGISAYQGGTECVFVPQRFKTESVDINLVQQSIMQRMIELCAAMMKNAHTNKNTEKERLQKIRDQVTDAAKDISDSLKKTAKIQLLIIGISSVVTIAGATFSLAGQSALTKRYLPENYSAMNPEEQKKALETAQASAAALARTIGDSMSAVGRNGESVSSAAQSFGGAKQEVMRTRKQLLESDLQSAREAKDAASGRIREMKEAAENTARTFGSISSAIHQR